jgi:hypothetical protein
LRAKPWRTPPPNDRRIATRVDNATQSEGEILNPILWRSLTKLRDYTYTSSAQAFFESWHSWAIRSLLTPIVEKAKLLNLNRFSIGQAQPGLSVGVLNNVELATLNAEAEQQRIAACLSSLDGDRRPVEEARLATDAQEGSDSVVRRRRIG